MKPVKPQSKNAPGRRAALSTWNNEGGAQRKQSETHDMTNSELVHLRCRVIALENVVIALLADGTPKQQALVREMATYISPRPGFTPHPLTLEAADLMVQMVDRSIHFQDEPRS